MKIKVKKVSKILSNKQDVLKITKEALSKAKKGKVDEAHDMLLDIGAESILDSFVNSKKLSKKELDVVENIISVCKILASNIKELMSDTIYDYALSKFKEFRVEPIMEYMQVSKRTRDTQHEFPKLKGTLDKANKIYESERFKKLDKCVETYIRKWWDAKDVNEKLIIRLSKKYDGASGVGSIDEDGNLISMLSRGEDDKGADLTHLFKDRKFNNKKKDGVKFEIIITQENYEKYCEEKNEKYANLRSAVTSILTAKNGAKYSHYLSLVPLDSEGHDDSYDSEQLNHMYADYPRFSYTIYESNDFDDMMKHIQSVIFENGKERDDLDFAIDGIVIDCLNKSVREKLGRKNDINQYEVAYKFPPMSRLTCVEKVSYTIGRTGLATPMVHYGMVDFNGSEHVKSSLSSNDRFNKLALKKNEIIELTYNNDVMPYVNKYSCKENDNNTGEPLYLPNKCECGNSFELIGANYYCNNPKCKGKRLAAMAFFYSTLGIRDMKEKKIKKMLDGGVINDSFISLLNPDYDKMLTVKSFSDKTVDSLKKQLDKLKETKIDEAKVAKAIGISGETTARGILSMFPIKELLKPENEHLLMETKIEGIEVLKKDAFLKNLRLFADELIDVMNDLNVVEVKLNNSKMKVCFSGFRDKKLKEVLEVFDIEVVDNVKKSLSYLIVKEIDNTNSKQKDARNKNIHIVTLSEFLTIMKEEFGINI